MSKPEGMKVPVSVRAVMQRINRALASEGERLCKTRPTKGEGASQQRVGYGDFYIVNTRGNYLADRQVDVEKLGRNLRVLRDWEDVTDETAAKSGANVSAVPDLKETKMASRSGKKKSGGKLSTEEGWDSQQLGRFGEKLFELWGTQANFTAHRSDPDIDGWDYYVQIRDRHAQPTPPFDEVPVTQCAKVQIRTLSERKGKCVVKLSTLSEMVNPTIPWFILAVVSKDGQTVDSAHLLHVHGDRLAEILRRLRKHKPGRSLSSATVTFDWDDSDELISASAQSFEARVRQAIGDPEHYIDDKRKFVSTVGFDESRFKGSMTVKSTTPGEGPYEAMSLFAVGLRDTLELSEYSVNEVRFGILKPKRAVTNAQDAKLTFKGVAAPYLKGTFEVSASDESVSFNCQFYSALGVFPFLPEKHVKYRFVAGPLSLVFFPDGRINVSFDAKSDNPWSVDLLGRVGKALRLMQKKATISIAIGNSERSPAARIKQTSMLPPDLASGLAMCEVARDLINRAGETADLPVKIDDIVTYQRELGFVSAALNPLLFQIEALNLGPESVGDAERQKGRDLDAFVGPFVEIGGKIIAPLIKLEGVASIDPNTGQTRVTNPAVTLMKVKTLAPGESGTSWWEREQAEVRGRPGAEVARIDPPYL